MDSEKLIIDSSVVQALLTYLASKPWQEVQEVMPILLNLTKIQENEV